MAKFDYETSIAAARVAYTEATEQVLKYNRLVDEANRLKIKGLTKKGLCIQTAATFRSIKHGDKYIFDICTEIAAATPFAAEPRVDLGF